MVRTAICALAGALAVIILLLLTPKEVFAPHGIALPGQQIQKSISAQHVQILHAEPTGAYRRVGYVRVELAFDQSTDVVKQQLFQAVKEKAASIGANAVITQLFVPSDGINHVFTFIGVAIVLPTLLSGSARS